MSCDWCVNTDRQPNRRWIAPMSIVVRRNKTPSSVVSGVESKSWRKTWNGNVCREPATGELNMSPRDKNKSRITCNVILFCYRDTSIHCSRMHCFHMSTVHFLWSLHMAHINNFPETIIFLHHHLFFVVLSEIMGRGFSAFNSVVSSAKIISY